MLMLTSLEHPPASALPALHYRTDDRLQALRQIVLDSLSSEASRRAYAWSLDAFFSWREASGYPPISRASIMQFRTHQEQRGLSSSAINLCLSAVRKMVAEAAENGIIDRDTAGSIGRIPGVKRLGIRQGRWLTHGQSQQLLAQPDPSTLKGKRDRAILALLIGCGLRRQELSHLRFSHLQQRESRTIIADMEGKGRRIRSIAVPRWVLSAVDAWTQAAELVDGFLFRRMVKGNRIAGASLSADAIWTIVRTHAEGIGIELAPHDLRRTAGKLMKKAGGDLCEIQAFYGHSSPETTMRYLGNFTSFEEGKAVNDRLVFSV